MSLIGKGSSSLRKKDVMEQKGVALGFKKLRFAHKASVGETGINLTTLVQPTEMAAHGFVNPPVAQLSRAQMLVYRSNLKLVSSLRGVLVDQLSYTIGSNTQINFIDFTAEDGEIFMGWLDELPTTSLTVVDGQKIIASGTLLAGQTDFNIGVPITINKNPSSQHGEVMVFADRGLQYRKAGNQASGAGDYIEVEVPGGLGSLLRFNVSGVDRFISVISNGVVAERPDGSMMAAIERVQGQVDQMVPTLAAVAGVPETNFQTGPNSVDLKQFGDLVLQLTRILDTEIPVTTAWQNAGPIDIFGTGIVKGPTVVDRVMWKQDGEDAIIRYEYKQSGAGAAGSSQQYEFGLPAGLVMDPSKIATTTEFDNGAVKGGHVGMGNMWNITDSNHGIANFYVGSTPTRVTSIINDGAGDLYVGNTAFSLANATVGYYFEIRVPIVGFKAKQTIREALGL